MGRGAGRGGAEALSRWLTFALTTDQVLLKRTSRELSATQSHRPICKKFTLAKAGRGEKETTTAPGSPPPAQPSSGEARPDPGRGLPAKRPHLSVSPAWSRGHSCPGSGSASSPSSWLPGLAHSTSLSPPCSGYRPLPEHMLLPLLLDDFLSRDSRGPDNASWAGPCGAP